MDKAKATSRPEGPPHNQVAAPCQATEYQPCYENQKTNKGKLKACTDYVHDLEKRLTDKDIQLTAGQKECQEAEQALSQARAKLTQQQEQLTGCQTRIQDLADRVVLIQANTQSMIMRLAEDFDKQLAEVQAEISAIISQFPSPPGTPEPPSVVWEGEGTLPSQNKWNRDRSNSKSKKAPLEAKQLRKNTLRKKKALLGAKHLRRNTPRKKKAPLETKKLWRNISRMNTLR